MAHSALHTAPVAIKASPVAPNSAEDPLTKDQWRTLLAFADAVVPCIVPSNSHVTINASSIPIEQYASTSVKVERLALQGGQSDLAKTYLEERPSQLPHFKENLHRFLALYTPLEHKKLLAFGLDTLK